VRFASVYRDFKDIDEFIDEIRSMGRNRAKNAAPRGGKSI
jgi:transcriptional regulator NrdR family protein